MLTSASQRPALNVMIGEMPDMLQECETTERAVFAM